VRAYPQPSASHGAGKGTVFTSSSVLQNLQACSTPIPSSQCAFQCHLATHRRLPYPHSVVGCARRKSSHMLASTMLGSARLLTCLAGTRTLTSAAWVACAADHRKRAGRKVVTTTFPMAAHPSDSQPGMHSQGGAPSFPSGLRLLVVDDDPTCLMIVAGMLRKCNYEGAQVSRAVFSSPRTRALSNVCFAMRSLIVTITSFGHPHSGA